MLLEVWNSLFVQTNWRGNRDLPYSNSLHNDILLSIAFDQSNLPSNNHFKSIILKLQNI